MGVGRVASAKQKQKQKQRRPKCPVGLFVNGEREEKSRSRTVCNVGCIGRLRVALALWRGHKWRQQKGVQWDEMK